jgi:hypothetical protein
VPFQSLPVYELRVTGGLTGTLFLPLMMTLILLPLAGLRRTTKNPAVSLQRIFNERTNDTERYLG